MFRFAFARALGTVAVLSVALAACNDDDPIAPPILEDARIYVVHGINGTDIGEAEGLPVDVRLNTSCVLTNVVFGTISSALNVAPGTYTVEVRAADAQTPCGGALVASAPGVILAEGANASVFAHLTATGDPTLTRFDNDLSSAAGARAVARHGAAFGAVDILVDDEVEFTNLANGQQQSIALAPGIYTITVVPTGTADPAFEVDVPFQAGIVYIAYAVGSPANDTFDVLLQQITMD